MSTRSSLVFFEAPDSEGRTLHIYSEMHDRWLYVEVQANHRPGEDGNDRDWHWMRLCPDTPENRAALKAAWCV